MDSKFLGMWKLIKIESFNNETGKWEYDPSFEGWTGYLLYDGQGHMGVQITPKGYKEFDVKKDIDTLSANELKDLVYLYQSNFVYFAKYTIKEDTIEHCRYSATNPSDWGTTIIRNFQFDGDNLILSPHETLWEKKTRLWWNKY